MTCTTTTRQRRTRGRFDFGFGVHKVAERRWQAFAWTHGRDAAGRSGDVRPVGPVFKTQWEAADQARHFSERREARFH